MPKKKHPKKPKKRAPAPPPRATKCSLYDFEGAVPLDDFPQFNDHAYLEDRLRDAVEQALMDGFRSTVMEELRAEYRDSFTDEVQVMLAMDELEVRDDVKRKFKEQFDMDKVLAEGAGCKMSKNLVGLVRRSFQQVLESEVPQQFESPTLEQVRRDMRDKLEQQFNAEVPAYVKKMVAECNEKYMLV